MGGGGSRPSVPVRAPSLPPTLQPTVADPSKGLSLGASQGCADCDFRVDPNISCSMVEMSRGYDPLGYDPSKPETAGKFSERTRVFIKPTLPFKARFGSREESFGKLSVYAPSPIRIENVQHDAVLQIGEETENGIVILVPLTISEETTDGMKFIGKIISAIDALSGRDPGGIIQKPLDAEDPCPPQLPVGEHKNGDPSAPITVCRAARESGNNKQGTDWQWKESLNKTVLPIYPIATGDNWKLSHMIGSAEPYYTWLKTGYVWSGFMWMNNATTTRFIVMQNPVGIAANDMASIARLPITHPTTVIDSLPGPDPGTPSKDAIFYKAFPPKTCVNCVADQPIPAFADIASATFGTGSSVVSTDTIVKILVGIVGSIALILAIYFGLRFAMGPYGLVLSKFGEKLGSNMAAAYAKAKRRIPTGAPGPSMNPKPPASNPDDIFPDFVPSDVFTTQNPALKNKGEFAAIQRRMSRPTPAAEEEAAGVGFLADRPAVTDAVADAPSVLPEGPDAILERANLPPPAMPRRLTPRVLPPQIPDLPIPALPPLAPPRRSRLPRATPRKLTPRVLPPEIPPRPTLPIPALPPMAPPPRRGRIQTPSPSKPAQTIRPPTLPDRAVPRRLPPLAQTRLSDSKDRIGVHWKGGRKGRKARRKTYKK